MCGKRANITLIHKQTQEYLIICKNCYAKLTLQQKMLFFYQGKEKAELIGPGLALGIAGNQGYRKGQLHERLRAQRELGIDIEMLDNYSLQKYSHHYLMGSGSRQQKISNDLIREIRQKYPSVNIPASTAYSFGCIVTGITCLILFFYIEWFLMLIISVVFLPTGIIMIILRATKNIGIAECPVCKKQFEFAIQDTEKTVVICKHCGTKSIIE